MKRKIVSLLTSLPVLLCFFILILFSIAHTGCNSDNNKEGPLTSVLVADQCADSNWLVLNIRFKQSVNKEVREICLKAIEKAITDTIAVLRTNTYLTYSPSVSIKGYPFQDSVSYQFKVSGSTDRALSIANIKDTSAAPGSDVPCKCPRCGICQRVKTISIIPGASQISKPLSEFLELVETP